MLVRLFLLVGLLVVLVPAQEMLDGPQLRFAFRRAQPDPRRNDPEDFYDILLPPIAKKSLRNVPQVDNVPKLYLLPDQMGRGIVKWDKKRKPRQFHISFVGIELADFVANKEGSGSPRLKEKLFKSG